MDYTGILRIPYLVTDTDLIARYRDTRVAHDESAKVFMAEWGAPSFLRADGGRPMGLFWTGDDMARIDAPRYAGFSFKNEYGGRVAYPRRSAKAEVKQIWQQSVDRVKLYITDYEFAKLCGWNKHPHAVMHNSRVHFPVVVDFGEYGFFLLVPRQLGDDATLDPAMFAHSDIPFSRIDSAYRAWKASRAD